MVEITRLREHSGANTVAHDVQGPISGFKTIDDSLYYIMNKMNVRQQRAVTTYTDVRIVSASVGGRRVSVPLTRDCMILSLVMICLLMFLLLSWQRSPRISELEAEVTRLRDWSNQLMTWQQNMILAAMRPHGAQ